MGSKKHPLQCANSKIAAGELRFTQPLPGTTTDCISSVEAPTSVIILEETAESTLLMVGTRSGHVITIQLDGQTSSAASTYLERLGEMSVELFKAGPPYEDLSAFAVCDTGLVLLTKDKSMPRSRYKRRQQVVITDGTNAAASSPPVTSVAIIPHALPSFYNRAPLMILTGSRILAAELHLQPQAVPRHIPINGTPTKLLYSSALECLVVAMRIGDRPTIMFLDPNTGTDLSRPTDKDGNGLEFVSGLGSHQDRIYGLHEWLYSKDNKTWLFLVVTTKGRLIILSTQTAGADPTDERPRQIRYWTRHKKKVSDEPVYSIVADADTLIYCAGRTLHWEALNVEEKRLTLVRSYELDSPASSLRVVNGKIYALTQKHSLVVIDQNAQLIHCDEVSRPSAHMIDMGDSVSDMTLWPVTLLCDRQRGLAGVWIPWKQPGREFKVLFEGQLPASMRKLRRGRTRPIWARGEQRPVRYGLTASTVDGAEVFGMGLDGSLQHFTLLSLQAWRFMRLIQNLALTSKKLYPHTYHRLPKDEDIDPEPVNQPKINMHINGDMLQRCFDDRMLEELIMGNGSGSDLLREYLDDLDGGKWTTDFQDEDGLDKYFELAYDVLYYFLAPVL
jgi:hypothetical protein